MLLRLEEISIKVMFLHILATSIILPIKKRFRFYSLLYKYLVLTAFFELTDILCVNETEAMIFAGYKTALDTFASEKEIEGVMKILLTKCKLVIITLGAKGAAYANRESGSSSYRKVDAPILSKGATCVFLLFQQPIYHFVRVFCKDILLFHRISC